MHLAGLGRMGLLVMGLAWAGSRYFTRALHGSFRRPARLLRASRPRAASSNTQARSAGHEFFRSLVRSLTVVLNADFALVGQLAPRLDGVETLAICFATGRSCRTLFTLFGARLARAS